VRGMTTSFGSPFDPSPQRAAPAMSVAAAFARLQDLMPEFPWPQDRAFL
jgi:hypothetical protein